MLQAMTDTPRPAPLHSDHGSREFSAGTQILRIYMLQQGARVNNVLVMPLAVDKICSGSLDTSDIGNPSYPELAI